MSELTVQLKPSRQFTVLLCSAHFTVACILWMIDGAAFLKLIGIVVLTISLYLYLWHHALLRSPKSIISLQLSEDGSTCTAQTRSNRYFVFTIKSDTFVAPYLTVLSLQSSYSFFSRCMVIFPDGIDKDTFRKLRVWLRWKWRK